MTATSLDTVLHRLATGAQTALSGFTLAEQAGLAQAMAGQDKRIIFDSLRPMGDEFWNMVDGRRTVAEIAEAVSLEFGFRIGAELFVPFAEGLIKAGLAAGEGNKP